MNLIRSLASGKVTIDIYILNRMECRPFTAGLEFAMNYIKMSVAQMNTKLSAIKQKQRINEKLDSLITDKIISADETIVQKAMTQFSDTDEEVILILGGVHLL